ncbi:TPA: DUF2799 domain-containing protein [Photobacterium damselae]
MHFYSKIKYLISLSLIILALFGCSSVVMPDKSWHDLGRDLALRGGIIVDYQSFEEKYTNRSPSLNSYQEYQDGYLVGLESFCDPNKAFEYGAQGIIYQGQCKGFKNEPEFRFYWQNGRDRVLFSRDRF